MGTVILTEQQINELLREAFEAGGLAKEIDLNIASPWISQNKAFKLYGKSNVIKWVDSGIVKEYRDINRGKTSPIRYSVLELKRASMSSNVILNVSQKEKNELIEVEKKINR